MADGLFEAPWTAPADPASRVLGYVALRRAIIGDGVAAGFHLPARDHGAGDLCEFAGDPGGLRGGDPGAGLRLAPDIAAALAAAGRDDIGAESVALHVQAVIQGGFILAKATGDPAAATDALDHLARYLRLLFTPAT